MASIIGPKYLQKVRSSDYKNSIYAIAELIDNSVDADAKNVEIITVTNQRNIDDIYFIDDGKGMDDVAKVDILGVQPQNIFVEFDNSKLAQLNISAVYLQQILKQMKIISNTILRN